MFQFIIHFFIAKCHTRHDCSLLSDCIDNECKCHSSISDELCSESQFVLF